MMQIKYRKIIIVIISLLLGSIGISQAQNSILSPTFPTIIPQTPEVTKLMGMINYPVSYNTGTVNTEIPLYEIRLRNGYTLPIKLVYQSSGFKPRERSNVGVGWTLVAEPQIAHVVNGLPDEDRNGLYVNKGLNVNWTSIEHPFQKYVYIDMAYGRYDIEPDQYFYQLPHKGGSFFFNRHPTFNDRKEFVTVPYDPIKIEGQNNLRNFSLTDIDGISYDFSPAEYTHTVDMDAGTYTDAITVYKATRILTPNYETIQFGYSSQPYPYHLSSYEQSATLDIKSTTNRGHSVGYCNGSDYVFSDDALAYTGNTYNHQVKLIQRDVIGNESKTTTFHVFGSKYERNNDKFEMCNYRGTNSWEQTINTQRLSWISFPGGSVEFSYTQISTNYTAQEVLTGVKVKDDRGNIVKQFRLISQAIGVDRPCLKEVQVLSNDGFSFRRYSFQYYNQMGIAYDTPMVNAWGYVQQQRGNNQTYIPALCKKFALFSFNNGEVTDSMTLCIGKDDYYKDVNEYSPNTTFMLKSITYPTGGKTEFDYEHSKFFESKRQKEVTTGSLRIKEIRNYQADGSLSSQRLFKYGKGESGLGRPVRLLEDTDFMTSYWQNNYFPERNLGLYWYFAYKMYKVDIHARPVVNDFLDASASIVYDQVAEYTDNSGKSGKIVYEYDYSNLSEIQSKRIVEWPNSLHPILRKESIKKHREWSTGQLICKSVYDSNGTLMEKEENAYIEKPGDEVYRMMIYPRVANAFHDSSIGSWETNRILKAGDSPSPSSSYGLPKGVPEEYQYDGRLSFISGCKLLHRKIATKYENGKAISDTTQYAYNNQLLHTTIEQKINNGKIKRETFSYPTDFNDEVSVAMTGMHILSPIVRHTVTSGNSYYDVYSPYRLQYKMPVIDRIETGKEEGKREVRIRFTKYDSYGNLQEAVKDNDKSIGYIYGYNSLYPVAKMETSGYPYVTEETVEMKSYTDSITLSDKCRNLREQLWEFSSVTSYTYKPLVGITSITQPNGNRTSYSYNKFGELINELDINGQKEKEYEYNYKYNGNQNPLVAEISLRDEYYVGLNTFTASAYGGYGGYRYQWFLLCNNNVVFQSQDTYSSELSYEFTKAGDYQLSCRVTDSFGLTTICYSSFKVAPDYKIKFEYLHYFADGNERFMEAFIDCPIETNVTFRLTYETDNWKGITFYINDKGFNRRGNGSDLVTVKLPKGNSHIYVVAPDTSPWYYVLMEKADAGVKISYPFMITKQ